MHEFHVCRPDRDPRAYRIPWDSETLLSCIPGHCVDLMKIGQSEGCPSGPWDAEIFPRFPFPQPRLYCFQRWMDAAPFASVSSPQASADRIQN